MCVNQKGDTTMMKAFLEIIKEGFEEYGKYCYMNTVHGIRY